MSLKQIILRELAKGPRTVVQLVGVTGAKRHVILKVLDSLISQHQVRAEKGVYTLDKAGNKGQTVPAKLVKLGKSFGFAAALDDGGDIFIPGHSLKGAMPGDEIEVQLFRHPRVAGSREGEVIAITKPNNRVVGVLEVSSTGKHYITPDSAPNTVLNLAKASGVQAEEGDKIAGEIIKRGEHHTEHRVVLTHRFGSADSAKQNAKAVLYAAGVEKAFPEKVKAEAREVAAQPIDAHEIAGRKDLRALPIFTIDAASTKDIDDAISVEKIENGYKVGVHIADVSHYVCPETALDAEALHRGTSVYYADSVIPMLPKSLSNGICSLNPQENRLAFSCMMQLDNAGRVVHYKFRKTVICSKVKGVYSEINSLLQGDASPTLQQKYAEVIACLPVLLEVYQKLAAQRAARGSMELDTDEAKLIINEEGICVDVEKRERGISERIIEELMLLANSCAANLARLKNIPLVYRVHDKPSSDRVEGLKATLTALGISWHTESETPTQKEYSELLDKTRNTLLARPVHYSVLRSMAKAKYEPLPKGHYGLGLADYAHFTSPIRRYPDLAVHRILSDLVAGDSEEDIRKCYSNYAAEAAAQSTQCELTAVNIERSCDDMYKAEYMRRFIGDTFEGIISSVMSFGVYVQLDNSVEGMIHVSQLSDRPLDLVEGIALAEPATGESWRLGDTVQVRVAAVDVAHGNVDFILV